MVYSLFEICQLKKDNHIQIATGLASYISLLVLAILLFKERTLWGDIPYHVFHILREDTFAIQNNRFGAILTQWVPLVLARMELSVSSILIAYSSIFILVYGCVYVICSTVFNDKKTALVMFFYSFLITTHTFFWMQSEYPQGISIMLLYTAYLRWSMNKEHIRWYEWPIFIISNTIIAYFHPLIFLPFLFISLFLQLSNEKKIGYRKLWVSTGFFILIFILKNTLFKYDSQYESNISSQLNRFVHFFPNYFDLEYHTYFLKYCISNYYFLLIFLALAIIHYLQYRNYLKLGLMLCFFGGNLLLVNVVFNQADFVSYYMENMYLPLVLYVGFPIAYDVLPNYNTKLVNALCIVIVTLMIGRVYTVSNSYHRKIEWQEAFMEKTSDDRTQKLIVDMKDTPHRLIKGSEWSSSYEYWLISILKDINKPRSIVVQKNTDKWIKLESSYNHHFITEWGFFDYSRFKNPYYFQFSDTSYYKIYSNKPDQKDSQ